MEMLYNPELMPEEEIKQTFVARQPLVDEIVTLIERQPKGAGMQHLVIIAPRGMGKTTVLLMVKFAIKDRGLAEKWQAIKFPEESYSIYDLADFWVETLNLLATETQDNDLSAVTEKLKTKYPNSDDLQEAAYATLKDWHKKHRKRLVLLVENFDQILEQINDERDNARLRDVLMNDGAVMLIGGATTFFKEARAYDQPLYNFFKIYNLADLKFEQMQELMLQRAEVDGIPNFEEKLKANRSQLRALEYFTGGNPRLVLMLYRVVTQSDISEVQRALEKLLDEVTPYYKHKIEILPPQQRKILDHIARISSQTREGVTPGEIATAVRLSPNQVSAQLKRLSELGYVRAANLRGRSSYYTLSEPLYAIWHQMRFGRSVRERMGWLINCLRALYDEDDLLAENQKLITRFREHVSANQTSKARDVLEHQLYLAEAIESVTNRLSIKKDVGSNFFSLGLVAYQLGKKEEALQNFKQAAELNPNDNDAWYFVGATLATLGRVEEAIPAIDYSLKISPDDPSTWSFRGLLLRHLKRFEEAIISYDLALELNPKSIQNWYERGSLLDDLKRFEEVAINYDRIIEIEPNDPEAWYKRGVALFMLHRFKDATVSFDQAIQLKNDHRRAWHYRSGIYMFDMVESAKLGELGDAKQLWDEALRSARNSGGNYWDFFESQFLQAVAALGHLQFARDLITESNLEEHQFPLARAIDYLLTGDEALIEKLSPEVRGVVEEIVARLRPTTQKKSRVSRRKKASAK